ALHDVSEAVDAADAIGHGDNRALGARFHRAAEVLDAALDEFADLGWVELHIEELLVSECGGHGIQSATHRRIDDLVANQYARAANELGIDLDLRADFAPVLSFQRRK